jgi:pyruvate dehydrogenase E1 component alpha subunit
MTSSNLDASSPVAMYRRMRLIRRFEEIVVELIDGGEMRAHAHLYIGEEAVAVGVSAALRVDDIVTSTHRGHGHILAKGGDPARTFAELLGRAEGSNKGRGGSMHAADLGLGIFGANGIVGAGAPMACGAARMFKARGEDHVAVPYFGDGAMNQGVVLESLNLAAIWDLPMVFICENNKYAITSPISEMARGALFERAAGFGLAAEAVDGMDVGAVNEAAARAVERARAGGGASFLECRTYRFTPHNTAMRGAEVKYRSAAEIAEWRARDPLDLAARRLDAEDGWGSGDRDAVDSEVEAELAQALDEARAGSYPAPESARDHMYAQTYPGFPAGVSE